jgi:hypothetical protein
MVYPLERVLQKQFSCQSLFCLFAMGVVLNPVMFVGICGLPLVTLLTGSIIVVLEDAEVEFSVVVPAMMAIATLLNGISDAYNEYVQLLKMELQWYHVGVNVGPHALKTAADLNLRVAFLAVKF